MPLVGFAVLNPPYASYANALAPKSSAARRATDKARARHGQPDHDREREVKARAGARHFRIDLDVLGGLGKAQTGGHDGNDADDDECKPGPIGEAFAVRGELTLGQLRRRDLRNRSNRSMIKPNAITAIAVRTQARKVRSLAAWSL